MNKEEQFETRFALHRYYIWSNRMWENYRESVKFVESAPSNHQEKAGALSTHVFMHFSYWMASLYVVVEDWSKYGINDPAVTELLKSKHLAKMKRYRNGVFHFQKKYYNVKFEEFLKEGSEIADWSYKLHRAVGDAFLKWFQEIGLKFEEGDNGSSTTVSNLSGRTMKFTR